MHYLYKTPAGAAVLLAKPLDPVMFAHMVLVETLAAPVDVQDMVFDANNKLAPSLTAASYRTRRARAYPPIAEQLDALWHAMDDGRLAKVAAFYDPIAAVKAANPKA